jgi:hypothetical protein
MQAAAIGETKSPALLFPGHDPEEWAGISTIRKSLGNSRMICESDWLRRGGRAVVTEGLRG